MSDPTLWRWERAGKFPKRVQLGGNSVGWIESEIDAWVAARAANARLPDDGASAQGVNRLVGGTELSAVDVGR